MAAGLGLLRLAPRDFWAMTPRELAAALRGLNGIAVAIAPPTHADLARLAARYPDANRFAPSENSVSSPSHQGRG
ncbi:MAG: phage tail assembly chaperone [Hyphomicrobiaceae bacterium]